MMTTPPKSGLRLDRRGFIKTTTGAAASFAPFFNASVAMGQPAAKTPFVLQLNWARTVEYAGIWMAMEKGYYAAEGLDFSVRDWSPTIEPIQAVVAGLAKVGLVSNGLSLVTARANGLPVKAIGTVLRKSAAGLVSKKATNITKPADLIGKRVGIPQTGRVTWDIFSAANGLTGKVTVKVVGFDLTPLLADQVDAYLAFSTNQPFVLAAQGIETNFIYFADHSAPRYDDVIFTTEEQLQRSGAAIVSWLRATRKGWDYAIANPQEAARITVDKYGKELVLARQLEMLQETTKLINPSDLKGEIFTMDEAVWANGIRIMKQLNLVPANFIVADLLASEPLHKALAR